MSKPLRNGGNDFDNTPDYDLPNIIPWPGCQDAGSLFRNCGYGGNHHAGHNNRFHDMLAEMPDAVLLIDREFNITFMNEAAKDMFGENIGMKCSEGLGGDTTICEYCPVVRSSKDGSRQRAQVEYTLAGGYIRYLDISVTPLAGKGGSLDEYIFVGHDMTSHRVAERQRRDMLSMISHDLKTQLSIIVGSADQLMEPVHDMKEESVDAVKSIIASAKNTSTLMDDFLCLSKLESGKLTIDTQPLPLPALTSFTLDTVKQLVEEISAKIHTDFSEDLPDVMVDFDRFGRIFTNIITNALKHGKQGVNIWIRARSEGQDGGMVRLEISDDGPGIAENRLPYVFDKYYTHARRGRSRGHGLGLAIVKKITELHGGTVEIMSMEGAGTTVILRLPSALSIR